jgi:CheY-like chemotaxis protein
VNASSVAEVLRALTDLAWPTLVAVVLWRSRHQIKEIVESAKTRKFTVKVAGNELTMEEAADQQRKLMSGLQSQILALQSEAGGGGLSFGLAGAGPVQAGPRKILWVDDHPRNNATMVAYLEDLSIEVVTASSTAGALAKLRGGRFGRIITDVGRSEEGGFVEDAGLRLIQEVRSEGEETPIIVYAGRRAVEAFGDRARAAGATEVTDNPGGLISALDLSSLDPVGGDG